jgi:general secretion pathway protein E
MNENIDLTINDNDTIAQPISVDFELFRNYSKELKDLGIVAIPSSDGKIYVEKDSFAQNLHELKRLQEESSRSYGFEASFTFMDAINLEIAFADALEFQDTANESVDRSSKALDVLYSLVQKGYDLGASDLHLVLTDKLHCHFRIDKKLNIKNSKIFDAAIGVRLFNSAINTAKGGGDIDHDTEQSKTFRIPIIDKQGNNIHLKVRAEKVPIDSETDRSQALFIRIVHSTDPLTLEQLNVDEPLKEAIKRHVIQPKGMILITGPTGSGKTTLLGGVVHEFPKHKSLRTVEDPVELRYSKVSPFITQASVEKHRWTKSLASMLRQDPDAILLGEVRTVDQANTCIAAAHAGHLVFSTLHTTSTVGTIDRLLDMGVELHELTAEGTLSLLVATKLAPATCKVCALTIDEIPFERQEMVNKLGFNKETLSNLKFANTYGEKSQRIPGAWNGYSDNCDCPVECNGGVKGVIGVAEFLDITDGVRQYLHTNKSTTGMTKWLKDNGWVSLEDVARFKVAKGLLDPFEIQSEIVNLFLNSTDETTKESFKTKYGSYYDL